jgi:CelD/BcsL family acetyltransferase involved in cellulose biosynthesis
MLRARIADGLSGLRSLRQDWERLHAGGNGGLFRSFAWMEAWAMAIEGLGQGDIRILIVEDTTCRCIVPLIVQHRVGVRRLRWLGVEVTDYCDVIAADGPDVEELAACIREHLPPADIVELRQIQAGSLASRIFDASPPAEGGQSCPRIAVADGNLPKDILYAERRAAGTGELRHRVAGEAVEREAVVAFVITQKRLSLLRQGIDTAEFDQRVTPFLRSLTDLAYPAGTRPYFSALTLNGQTIAAQIGFIENRTLFYYLPAFDAAFRQHSPGHLLLLNLVRDAARLELETVDLLRGQEPYKFKWTSVQHLLAAAEWTVTLRGRAFALARRFASGQARRPDIDGR